MKKLLILTLSVLTAFALIACGNKEEAAEETTAAATEETEAAEETGTAVQPESYGTIELGEYMGIEATKTVTTITDDDVENEIQAGLNNYYMDVTGRPVQNGDNVIIDYVGKIDGVAFDGGTGTGKSLTIGSGQYIPGFEEGLIGAEIGETRDLDLTFPEDYWDESCKGKDVVFTVTVNSIQEKRDEPDDEWAAAYTQDECKTVDELRERIKVDLTNYYDQEAVETAKSEILDKIISNSTLDLNQDAIDYEYDQLYNTYVNYTQTYYQMDMDTYLAQAGMEKEEFESQITLFAQNSVEQKLVVDAIFDAEGMELTDADEEIMAEAYNSTVEDMKSSYGEDLFKDSVKTYKVLQFLYDNAKITEVEAETEAAE